MISLFWNIRGIANKASRCALKKLILKNSPDLVFIAEPWMDFALFPKTWLSRLNLKLFALNSRHNQLPNLWCLCNISLDPIIINCDDQQVSFKINLNGTDFGYTAVY